MFRLFRSIPKSISRTKFLLSALPLLTPSARLTGLIYQQQMKSLPLKNSAELELLDKKQTLVTSSIIDENTSNPCLVDIEGLPKERVLIALFKNVYKKSGASYRAWMHIADLCYFGGQKAPIGEDYPPYEDEAQQILAKDNNVDYIGPVMFKIDFSTNIINTTNYDREHETSSNSKIKSAKECIAELRAKIELERIEEAERIETIKKEKELMTAANDLLKSTLGNNNCWILSSSLRTIQFDSNQSFVNLQNYAEKLISKGLSVEVTEGSSGKFWAANPKLEIVDPIESIVEKLSASSQAKCRR